MRPGPSLCAVGMLLAAVQGARPISTVLEIAVGTTNHYRPAWPAVRGAGARQTPSPLLALHCAGAGRMMFDVSIDPPGRERHRLALFNQGFPTNCFNFLKWIPVLVAAPLASFRFSRLPILKQIPYCEKPSHTSARATLRPPRTHPEGARGASCRFGPTDGPRQPGRKNLFQNPPCIISSEDRLAQGFIEGIRARCWCCFQGSKDI